MWYLLHRLEEKTPKETGGRMMINSNISGPVAGKLAEVLLELEEEGDQKEPTTLELLTILRREFPVLQGFTLRRILNESPLFTVVGVSAHTDGTTVEHWGTCRTWGSR